MTPQGDPADGQRHAPSDAFERGPIVVGGVGGSGTRVVAEILQHLGVFLGHDLNDPKDHLSFTLLFKRPSWLSTRLDNADALEPGFSLLAKRLCGVGRPSASEWAFLMRATADVARRGHNFDGIGRGRWAWERARRLAAPGPSSGITAEHVAWGWKEPNTHLLIEPLAQRFPNFKYIHVIRHGLDMALSANQNQLFNWGALFGVEPPARVEDRPAACLRYWIRANRRAVALGERLGRERFLLLNFDRLCREPRTVLEQLLVFLNLESSEQRLRALAELPQTPRSMGRYQSADWSRVPIEELEAVRTFGFDLGAIRPAA